MKKQFFILAALLGLGTTVRAQENVSWGPVLGVTSAKFSGDINDARSKTGLTAGLFLNYSTESRFGLLGQLLYTQLGTRQGNGPSEVNLNYIQLPILATFFLNDRGNPIRPKLFAGPHFGLLVGATNENGTNLNGDANNRAYRAGDIGLTLGGGLNARLSQKVWLNADIRYGLGLTDVTTAPSTLNNRNWGVNAGVSFPLGQYQSRSGRFTPTRGR
jgi:hypothetical protein